MSEESWFEKPVATDRPSSMVPPPPPPARAPRFGLGVLVGAIASAGGLEIARLVAEQLHKSDPILFASAGGAMWVGFAVAALAGAPFGGALAVVMMQGSRFVTRAIFATIFSVAIWFCVHIALVARAHTPPPPLLPMLAGAAIFGLCVAFIPRASGT